MNRFALHTQKVHGGWTECSISVPEGTSVSYAPEGLYGKCSSRPSEDKIRLEKGYPPLCETHCLMSITSSHFQVMHIILSFLQCVFGTVSTNC